MRLGVRSNNRQVWRAASLILALFVIGLAVGAPLGLLWLKHAMRQQLPALDGSLKLPGLSAPVTVMRDELGVPHIRAANLDDLLEAQGFVSAQDRLWQMDMARRYSSGEISEILGSSAVNHDKAQRVLLIRSTAERLTSTMPPGQQRLFEAYARGVNAFISMHQESLPAEFRLLHYQPRPWQPVDCWLVALTMVERLDTVFPEKLDREQVQSRLAPALAAELYPTTTWRDHPPTQSIPDLAAPQQNPPAPPPDEPRSTVEDLLQLRDTLRFGDVPCALCRPGSNEWAVSGEHTASGKPLLSNDMHLEHSIPDIWHEEDLEAGSFHVAGVTVPGIPFIIAGHNQHIAWGFTTLGGDVQDVYIEKTNGDGEYWSGNGWRRPEHEQDRIRVRGGRDVVLDLEITEHGPVITPLLPHESRMISLNWTVYRQPTGGLPLQAMDAANNWAEFRQAVGQWWAPTQNMVYADDQGHIGYQAVGAFPLRPAGLSAVPIVEKGTAADSQHEWQGWIPFAGLPTVLDPPGGIVATANARITPDGDPYPLTLDWADPYRNERIWKWLAARQKLTRTDMLALEMDTYSAIDQELAQRFAYAIDHASKADARMRQAADLMRVWDGRVQADSVAAEIVDASKNELWPLVLKPKLGQRWMLYRWQAKNFAQEEMVTNTPAAWLPPGVGNWNDLMAEAVRIAITAGRGPLPLKGWTYGSRHTIELEHPLYSLLPFFRWTSIGPLPLSGDQTTVDQSHRLLGPSQRFTMDWSDVDGSTENIVSGESGDPLSPYYRDQWLAWYHGRTFPLPFTDAAVSKAAKHTLRLLP